jgi:hypothetical protein
MQGSIGDLRDIRFLYILAADSGKHLTVYLQLAISAILAGGPDAAGAAHQDEKKNGAGTSKYGCF